MATGELTAKRRFAMQFSCAAPGGIGTVAASAHSSKGTRVTARIRSLAFVAACALGVTSGLSASALAATSAASSKVFHPSKAKNPRPFYEGWLPPTFSPTAFTNESGSIGGSGPVKTLESVVYETKSESAGQLLLSVALASQYSAGYWKRFSDSSAWMHSTYEGRLVIYATTPSSTLAMTEIGKYLVTVTGLGHSARDAVTFAQRLRYAP